MFLKNIHDAACRIKSPRVPGVADPCARRSKQTLLWLTFMLNSCVRKIAIDKNREREKKFTSACRLLNYILLCFTFMFKSVCKKIAKTNVREIAFHCDYCVAKIISGWVTAGRESKQICREIKLYFLVSCNRWLTVISFRHCIFYFITKF